MNLKSLPVSKDTLNRLFDYLYEQMKARGCDDELTITTEFLIQNGVPTDDVLAWLKKHGGYCDCEVIYNVAVLFPK